MSDKQTTLRCADITPYLSAYADGELAEPLRSQVAAHVATCDACSAQLERISTIDGALAGLRRTAPSPEVFERISAAVAQRPREATVRESLRASGFVPRLAQRQTRIEFPRWGQREASPAASPRMPRWVAASLPAVAALLLISLALVVFRGFNAVGPGALKPTPIPTVGPRADMLAKTTTEMDKNLGQLSFAPIYPTYLPPEVTDVHSVVTTASGRNPSRLLDVTWTLSSGLVQEIRLREAPKGALWSGYTPNAAEGRSWQIGDHVWVSLSPESGSDLPAVGQDRGDVSLVLAATPRLGSAGDPLAVLRFISLSMDRQYQRAPTIYPSQTANLVQHYTAQVRPSNGVIYNQEAWAYPAQSAARVEVTGSDGSHYADVIHGVYGLHLDLRRNRYQETSTDQTLAGSADLSNSPVTQVFYNGLTYANAGQLWYVGLTRYNGGEYHEFRLVDAPRVIHVYVDRATNQVVTVTVDDKPLQVSGPFQLSRLEAFQGCLRFTKIELLQPAQVQQSLFSTAVPAGFSGGQVAQPPSC